VTNGELGTDTRPLGELFSELASETGTLMRKELELARVEVLEKVKDTGKDAGIVGLGGTLAHAGGIFVLLGVVLLLGLAIPLWLSALIVGVLAAGGGLFMVRQGATAMKKVDMKPRATVATLKENGAWMRRQLG
jgi:hypothetical protein